MTRVLYEVLLFALPFIVFFSYAVWANSRRRARGDDPLQTPWYWLVVLGLVFAIAGFFIISATQPAHTGRYIPAQVGPDGKIIPGHYEGDGGPPVVPPPHAPPPEPPPPPVPTSP